MKNEEKIQANPKTVNKKTKPKKKTQKKLLIEEILILAIKIVVIATVTVAIFTFVFGVFRNGSPSMAPSIKDGDLVWYYRLDKMYISSDVLVMEYEDELIPLRVVAVAGDEVDIKEEGLYINGALQIESEIYELTHQYVGGVKFPLTVGDGEVFVLGDSRENATDSRIFGTVSIKDTKGKVMAVIRRRGI